MSTRICYLQRSDRGDQIESVRLVGPGADEVWVRPDDETLPNTEAVRQAAEWVRSRLGRERAACILCVDPVGAACAWLTAPSADPRVLTAALRLTDDHAPASADAPRPEPFGALQAAAAGEGRIQALTTDPPEPVLTLVPRRTTPVRRRTMPVIAMRDALAGLFLDALDERGVAVGSVTSLWHALPEAWDPGGPAGRDASAAAARTDDVAATDSPLTGLVAIDPAGRLVWSWSRAGRLAAAGIIMLPAPHPESGPRVRASDIGRLTADWLSWSAQIGAAPSRVICLGSVDAGAGAETGQDGQEREGGLGAAELGRGLARALPSASVDLVADPDPIGRTLARLVGLPAGTLPRGSDPSANLVALTHRRGRAHRALYRWVSIAMVALAIGLGWLAWQLLAAASAESATAQKLLSEEEDAIRAVLPAEVTMGFARALRERVAALEQDLQNVATGEPAMPILRELEAVSLLFGMEEFQTTRIVLDQLRVTVEGTVASLETAEGLTAALSRLAGSSVERWERQTLQASGDRFRVTFTGTWRPDAGRRAP